jgi:ferrous iron transport protein B
MGAIKNEVGNRWASFAGIWSFTLAYLMATLCFQVGNFFAAPLMASIYIAAVLLSFTGIYFWLKHKGRKVLTIPISVSYT